jgi:trimethylamine:corrinoid methyltransferase-like protein
LGEKHTRDHMREASMTRLIDRHMYDAWLREGGTDIRERAHEEALRILENHKVDPLPEPVRREIRGIIEEAEEELTEQQAREARERG